MALSVRELRAAVAGTGPIGAVHVEALRRLGVEVLGVVASTPSAQAKGLTPAYDNYEALLADERVDVVTHHDAEPPPSRPGARRPGGRQARRLRETTGDHVGGVRGAAELAQKSGLVHCTNFNLRFYPIAHQARSWRRGWSLPSWNVTAEYLKDWLLYPLTGTGASSPRRAGHCGPSLTSARTGWISRSG